MAKSETQENKDFISIYLQNGSVVMHMYLGGDSELRLASDKTYHDGKIHTIGVSREGGYASLIIDQLEKKSGTAPGGMSGLDVKSSDHFFGGVPATIAMKNSYVQ